MVDNNTTLAVMARPAFKVDFNLIYIILIIVELATLITIGITFMRRHKREGADENKFY